VVPSKSVQGRDDTPRIIIEHSTGGLLVRGDLSASGLRGLRVAEQYEGSSDMMRRVWGGHRERRKAHR
jgi:hypothetical protein